MGDVPPGEQPAELLLSLCGSLEETRHGVVSRLSAILVMGERRGGERLPGSKVPISLIGNQALVQPTWLRMCDRPGRAQTGILELLNPHTVRIGPPYVKIRFYTVDMSRNETLVIRLL